MYTACASRWRKTTAQADGGRANVALADFIAPVGTKPDWIGGFAVTAGHGEAEIAKAFKDKGDDYSAIMAAALSRPAGGSLRRGPAPQGPHRAVGLCGGRGRSIVERHDRRGQYRGIRPAPGYPAQPDHTEKAERCSNCWTPSAATGLELTESFAMYPNGGGVGALLQHIRRATISGSAGSRRIRSRTMRGARGGICGQPSGGWLRF